MIRKLNVMMYDRGGFSSSDTAVEPCKFVRICSMHDLIVHHFIKEKFCFIVSNAALLFVSSCLLRSRPGSSLTSSAVHHALTRIFEDPR